MKTEDEHRLQDGGWVAPLKRQYLSQKQTGTRGSATGMLADDLSPMDRGTEVGWNLGFQGAVGCKEV